MAPFTMCCRTCGEFICESVRRPIDRGDIRVQTVADKSRLADKGKKFNAKKETALGETYYGIKIFRFYIVSGDILSRPVDASSANLPPSSIRLARNARDVAPRSHSRRIRRTLITSANTAPVGISSRRTRPCPGCPTRRKTTRTMSRKRKTR
jgi:hypothetical protein